MTLQERRDRLADDLAQLRGVAQQLAQRMERTLGQIQLLDDLLAEPGEGESASDGGE